MSETSYIDHPPLRPPSGMPQPLSPYGPALAAALSDAGILLLTLDGRRNIVSFNKALESATGSVAARVVGLPVADFVTREAEAAYLEQLVQKILSDGAAREFLCHWKSETRERLFSLSISKGDQQADGSALVILVGRDFTERQRADHLLRGTGIDTKIIFDQIPAVIWAVDRNLVITVSTGAALKSLGFGNNQLVGSSLFAYLATDSESDIEIISHRRALAGETVRRNTKIEGRTLESLIQPLRADGGEIIGAVGIAIDVTEREETVEFVRRQQAELNTILDAAPAYIWYKDRDNKILRINATAATALGKSVAEVEGRSTYDLYPDFAEKYHQDDLEVINSGKPKLEIIEPFTEPTGEIRWMRTDKIPYRDERGEIIGVIVFALDITDRKRAEEAFERSAEQEKIARLEAERLGRIKDEFLITLSHELRTPLMPILGWTDLLVSGALDAKATSGALKAIERNAKLELQLIEDLLDTSRIISGTLRLDMQRIELGPIITAAVETVRLAAEAKGITLDVQTLEGAPSVIGDTKRLRQVFWNLLANAVKFTPRGAIKISQHVNNGGVISVDIEDTGVGIAPEFLPHAFERFRQANSSTSRVFGGLGLGLALVRHIVEGHGGQVVAASRGTGQGATFTVTLPVAAGLRAPNDGARADSGEPAESAAVTYPLLSGLKVLVVEDTDDDRDLIKSMLRQQNVDAAAVASAKEALALAETWVPDLVVSDIGLPEMDGYEMIRELRRRPSTAGGQAPAIALTAYASADDRNRALAAGFQRHLPKPVSAKALLSALTELATRG